MRGTASAPLMAHYRGLICDLDGVVYRGPEPIPHAVAVLEQARASGLRIVYATNNGSRAPQEVADHLAALGLTVTAQSVVISAQAAAALLRERLGEGAPVLGVGGPGVGIALAQAGLRLVTTAESAGGQRVEGVLQSYGRDVAWTDLAEISYVVNAGALWVASNGDLTLPTGRGIAPGNGSLVRVVRAAVAVDPVVVGKPNTPLYELSAAVLATRKEETLAVGDRLDTDIEGANRAGIAALLVLTGVSDVADVALAAPMRRPRFLAGDLRALREPYVDAEVTTDETGHLARCGAAVARVEDGRACVSQAGSLDERARALVTACWSAVDAGEPPERETVAAADPTRNAGAG